jgi:F-type H+-transporting ATPase subunit delta
VSEDRVEGYAAAFLEVARAEGLLPRVEQELFGLSHTLDTNDELRRTLSDASIPPERRQSIVEDLLGSRFLPLTASLVSFVVSTGRARELPAIIEKLVERSAAERKHALAEVRSAIPLSDDQKERLAKALSENLGQQVEVKVIVDPEVMGGLVARVGDIVIDGTVRHRLDQLKEAI